MFTEKVNNTNHHLRLFFPQYTGPDHDVSAAKEFIKDQFLARNTKRKNHFTTVTDTNNVIFQVMMDTIIQQQIDNHFT